jgi:hypothetical protein
MNFTIKWFDEDTGQIGVVFEGYENAPPIPIAVPLDNTGKYLEGIALNNYVINFFPSWHVDKMNKIKRGIPNADSLKAQAEVVRSAAPKPVVETTESKWEKIRALRNMRMFNSDWTQLSDSPLTDAKKQEWAVYRNLLRNIPTIYTSPDLVQWPVEPQ